MSDSPYRSPGPDSYSSATIGPDREKLRRVARYQRWVLCALLAQIVTNIISFALNSQGMAVQLAVLAVALVVVVFAIASIFLLAKEVVNTGVGVLCAILMIVPCISLLVLLIINQKATSFLQKSGVNVGFMGVDPNTI